MIKKLLFSYFIALFAITLNAQDAGIFQTYAILDSGSGNSYLAGGANADGAAAFNNHSFGTISSLKLNGGEVKSWKNGGANVSSAEINYRVYLQGSTAPAFTTINLPYESELNNPTNGDQRWQETASNIDLIAPLTSTGTYNIEVYWKISTSVGDKFDSNSGSNYTATFTITSLSTPNNALDQNTKLLVNNKQVKVNSTANINTIEVYNLLGKSVYSNNNFDAENTIDLQMQPKGMYIVKLTTATEQKSYKILLK